LIDPELIKLEELPDPTAGAQARSLWSQHDTVLAGERAIVLGDLKGAGGIESALLEALGAAPAGSASWSGYFQSLAQDLLGNDQAKADAATATIQNTLLLPVDGFERIVDVMTQLSGAAGSPVPDETQLLDVAALLTTSWKRRTLYVTWYGDETA